MKERTVEMADFYRISKAEGTSPGLVFLSNERAVKRIKGQYSSAENNQHMINKMAENGSLNVAGTLFKLYSIAIEELPFVGNVQ